MFGLRMLELLHPWQGVGYESRLGTKLGWRLGDPGRVEAAFLRKGSAPLSCFLHMAVFVLDTPGLGFHLER